MKLFKPKFWDKKIGVLAIFFLPFSLVYKIILFLIKNFSTGNEFSIPIICVGNIYLGGTGKTPASIFIAKEFEKRGKKIAIVRKYYESHKDEHNLIKRYFKNLILTRDRSLGIIEAVDKKMDAVILDDGFQDHKIIKNFNIICFNQTQKIGNGLVIPAGPLREDLNNLSRADIILINGKKDKNFEKKIFKINNEVLIFYSNYKLLNIKKFRKKNLIAFAGIGNPSNFFDLLKKNKLKIKKKYIFPDHYDFKKEELTKLITEAKKNKCQIITTEKDYYRIRNLKLNSIKYLKVKLEIKNKHKLINSLTRNEKIN